MGIREEAELLKKRALEFLENAKENLEKKRFDLAAFNAEQSLQLLLKYFLFIKAGDYPKTHSLKTLFKLASEFCQVREMINFAEEVKDVILNAI